MQQGVGWNDVINAVKNSKKLLECVWNKEEESASCEISYTDFHQRAEETFLALVS